SKKKKTPNFNLYKSSLAWAITLVFSIGALTMYALIAWLPTILVATAGKTTAVAGVMLSVYNLTGLPHSIILPTLMNKVKRPYYFVLLGSILAIIGILGLGYLPQYSWGWIFPLGVSALLVPAGLTLVNLKSKTEAGVTALSGFVQSVGYIIAALGPFYVGHLHSTYHNWLPTCWFICAMAIVSALAGIVATRPKYIEDNLK
ncbi:MAG: MFS transporter, partial [Pseudopedobacter saltans]